MMMHIGPALTPARVGDTVVITNGRSPYCGQTGIVVSPAKDDKLLCVKHDDGQVVAHPWGYQIVERSASSPANRPAMPDRADFADWQNRLGLSRADAVKILNLSRQSIHELYHGATPHPSTQTLMAVCEEFPKVREWLRRRHARIIRAQGLAGQRAAQAAPAKSPQPAPPTSTGARRPAAETASASPGSARPRR